MQAIKRVQQSRLPNDPQWAQQRIDDVSRAIQAGKVLRAQDGQRIAIDRIIMDRGSYHSFFLVFDRPLDAAAVRAYEILVSQTDAQRDTIIGGLSARVEPAQPRAACGRQADTANLPEPARRGHLRQRRTCGFTPGWNQVLV